MMFTQKRHGATVLMLLATLGLALTACSSSGDNDDGSPTDGGAGGMPSGGSGNAATGGSSASGGTTVTGGAGGSGAVPTGGTGGAPTRICTSCDEGCEHEVAVASANHVVVDGGLEYGSIPPAGGDHDPCWADWGVYDSELAARHWVHNLEHGGVVFVYSCPSGCDDEIAALAEFVQGHAQTILTKYPYMDEGFAVVSWGHRLLSSCLDMEAMAAFYDAYVNRAPESVTSGAPAGCMPSADAGAMTSADGGPSDAGP